MRLSLRVQAERTMPLVLSALLLTIGVLLYEAVSSAHSHRSVAEGVVRHYADVAAWQFGRTAQADLQTTASLSAFAPLQRALRNAGESLPPASALLVSRTPDNCDCPPPLPVLNAYRVTREGAATAARGWKALGDSTRIVRLVRRVLEADSTEGRGDPCLMVVDSVAGRSRALSVAFLRTVNGGVNAAYIAESDVAALEGVFKHAARRAALFPPTLIDSASRSRGVTLTAWAGPALVFGASTNGTAGRSDLPAVAGSTPLIVGATLNDALTPLLVVGGLPSSRLPLLIFLAAITAVLFAVAVVQTRRSEALARLRGDFVASVSHELRTPLALMRVYAETLQLERVTSVEERHRFLEVIIREIRRLTTLVENVLTFSDIERGRIEIRPSTFELGMFAHRLLEEFRPIALQRQTRIDMVVHLDSLVETDEAALRQILLNLMTNALKYGPDGQRITVTLARLAGRARITIDDEGPGIPEADRRRVFERYYRRLHSLNPTVAGSGIGLAVVKELARAQGIEVRIGEAPGGGARVFVEIPAPDESRPKGNHDRAFAGV